MSGDIVKLPPGERPDRKRPRPGKRGARVLPFNGITRLNLSPDRVLEGNKGRLEGLVLIGWGKDGDFVFSSTYADGGEVLWLLETARKKLLEVEADDLPRGRGA